MVLKDDLYRDERVFPDCDYNASGKLKKIRPRVFKKLLKYEFKALFKVSVPMILVLLVLGIALGVQMRFPETVSTIIFTFIFVILTISLGLVAICVSSSRFRSNFFGKEGYLMLSVPASAEEQIWAKHLSGIIVSIINDLAIFLIILIVAAISSAGVETEPSSESINALYVIEYVLICVVWSFGLFFMVGALNCMGGKTVKKSNLFIKGIIIYFAVVVGFSVITTLFVASPLAVFLATPLGLHLLNWFWILLGAGLSIGAYFYELKTLKRPNLQ